MSKGVTDIKQARTLREIEHKQNEYKAKLKEDIRYKQKRINVLAQSLQTAEIDEKTMSLLSDVYSVFLANWSIRNLRHKISLLEGGGTND